MAPLVWHRAGAHTPYAIDERMRRQIVPVKQYSGDNVTDAPEFEEVAQTPMALAGVLQLRSATQQLKLELLPDGGGGAPFPGLYEHTVAVAEVLRRRGPGARERAPVVWRLGVSGAL